MNPTLRRKKSVFAFVLKDTKRGKVCVCVGGGGGGGCTVVFVVVVVCLFSGQNGIHQNDKQKSDSALVMTYVAVYKKEKKKRLR